VFADELPTLRWRRLPASPSKRHRVCGIAPNSGHGGGYARADSPLGDAREACKMPMTAHNDPLLDRKAHFVGTPAENHLIARLTDEPYHRLRPFLERVPMPLGKVLYESGGNLRHVYFPADCIISLLYVMESGASAEISVVGNEGLVGVALFMGGETTPSRAIVQSAGSAYRLPAAKLKEEFNRHGELLVLLMKYSQALVTQMAQTAVCNRHHSIDQQLCRWLLLSLDRLSGLHLVMTQELIANMLGVRREGVTEAAGKLQKQGVITYSRGRIHVLDRPKLESLACECYEVVRVETERLLPQSNLRRGERHEERRPAHAGT